MGGPLGTQAARFEAVLCTEVLLARGHMENRIKEQQMDLFADRTSTHWMASNQLRLWFSTFAHLIMSTLQAEFLKGTELESASIRQIGLRLFRIAVGSKRALRIDIQLCTAYPLKAFSAWFTSDSCLEQSRIFLSPTHRENVVRKRRTQGTRALFLKRATIWPSSSKIAEL